MSKESEWALAFGTFGTMLVLLLFMLVVRMEGKSAGLDFDNPCNVWVYDDMRCQHQRLQTCISVSHYSTDQCIRIVRGSK
jgi:hypothetical protein